MNTKTIDLNPHQFEFGKFFADPSHQTYLHIIRPITQIQIWKIMLALLAILFESCSLIDQCSSTICQYRGGFLVVKLAKLVYEQIIFKLAGWIAVYFLAAVFFAWAHGKRTFWWSSVDEDEDEIEMEKELERSFLNERDKEV